MGIKREVKITQNFDLKNWKKGVELPSNQTRKAMGRTSLGKILDD